MRSASPGFSKTVGNESMICKQLPEYPVRTGEQNLHSVEVILR